MTTKTTKLIGLGRSTAVKTFTRINNLGVKPRKRPASKNARVTTQQSCVAYLKVPLFLVCTLVILALAAAPAMAEYGLQRFALSATNENGTPDLQAGSHPYALTNTFLLNLPAEGNLKDVRLELPPGLVGDPNATPHCSYRSEEHTS